MAIFRRRGKDADETGAVDEQGETALTSTDEIEDVTADDASDAESDGSEPSEPSEPPEGDDLGHDDELDGLDDEEPFNRARGPYDITELDEEHLEEGELPERLDLGALRFVPVDGMQLRLELDESQETVLSAHAILGESSVQLQAFAAPRTFPVWPDIRSEIADSIVAGGGTADVVDGALGRELLCRMPQQGPDGRTVFGQVRFCGIDGPRWFLRAVISGKAAVDEAAAAPLVELVRSVVVVRGDGAMPPREVLPLQLPPGATGGPDAAEGVDDPTGPDEGTGDPQLDDLKPFERGPEITEVR